MSGRRLAITRKISLADFSEDWDECYVLVSAVTLGQAKELSATNTDEMDNVTAAESIAEFVKTHVVGGKVKLLDENDEPQLTDIVPGDIDQMNAGMINHIFTELTTSRQQYRDPKASTNPNGNQTSSGLPAESTDTTKES